MRTIILAIMIYSIVVGATSSCSPATVQVNTPLSLTKTVIVSAFDEAEGFGSDTPGGRFGRIVFVTNLSDTTDTESINYVGSFRWAVEHTWNDDPNDPYDQRRIIVFKVGGEIQLSETLYVKNPFVTIAGQTAPGDGIVLRGEQFTIATHDVVVRYLRFRVGDEGSPTCCRDGINISTSQAGSDVYNVILDHVSVSWAIDENISFYTDPQKPYRIHDVTVQWSIISEGLYNSIHVDEGSTSTDPHSMGMNIGQSTYNVTLHHNLFAYNWGRNPRISGVINFEMVNNVVQGWGNAAVEFSADQSTAQVIGNYFKAGLDSRPTEIKFHDPMDPASRIYLDKNISDDPRNGETLAPIRFDDLENIMLSSTIIFRPGVEVSPTRIAYQKVLDGAGANVPGRDAVDLRIVQQVENRKGAIIDSQNQVGGWPEYKGGTFPIDNDNDGLPDDWEITNGLNPNDPSDASDSQKLASNGLTWIEVYFEYLVTP